MKLIIPPGATPIDDLSGLKAPITTQSQLDALEFDNIHEALRTHFKLRKLKNASWFHELFLRELHRAMFGKVWEWAGKYRTKDVLPIGVEPHQIPTMMVELCHDVEYWLLHTDEMSFIEMGARIHHRLAWIHPFPNGNGRFSRFVSDLFLYSYRCILPSWPIGINKVGSNRAAYLVILREADQGNLQPLLEYLITLGAKNPILKTLKRSQKIIH
jgi:Fic-DOC domain mobile mystery protein B